jgi:peroxiredoxin
MKATLMILAGLLVPAMAVAQKGTTTKPPSPIEAAPWSPRNPPPISGQVGIGESAPDFQLDGSRGRPVKLSGLRGDWVLLAFSDRWLQHSGLKHVESEIATLGARVVGVCREKAKTLENAAQRDTLKYLLLADVTGEISAMYGLYDHERSEARPGFLMIDRKGVVRMALLGQLLPPDEVARLARFAITGL